jgi:hypothetical protein
MAPVLLRSQTDAQIERALERKAQRRTLSPLAAAAWDDIRAAVLIPASKIDYSQVTAMRMALRDTVQAAVGRTTGQGTIIRDLVASDVSGVASGAAFFARLANKNALVARTLFVNDLGFRVLPQNVAIGIYGFMALAANPLIDVIQFTLGAVAVLGQFNLQALYVDSTSSIGYFDPPMVWKPGQSIGINLLSEVAIAASAEPYGLLGYVAEPGGQTVAPDQSNLV